MRLGIDIGGVIIKPARESGDTSFFSGAFLETPAVDKSLETIRTLNEPSLGFELFLVSKARSGTAEKTRKWLDHINFFNETGLDPVNLYFVEERKDKDKIAKRLGLNAFVDDHVGVLNHLTDVNLKILFAESEEWIDNAQRTNDIKLAVGWPAVYDLVLNP